MFRTPNRQQKRGAIDEPKVGDTSGGNHDDMNKKRFITNIHTSLNAPSHELPIFEPHGGNQKNGDKDENDDEVLSQRTQVDGSVNGGLSKRRAHHDSGAGDIDPTPHQQRRLWVKDWSGTWWKQCNSPDYSEAEFCNAFRMGRATFNMICEALSSAFAKENTALHAVIPVRQRVAICIWRLTTGKPMHRL